MPSNLLVIFFLTIPYISGLKTIPFDNGYMLTALVYLYILELFRTGAKYWQCIINYDCVRQGSMMQGDQFKININKLIMATLLKN